MGGVIRPGEVVIEIVPVDDMLLIEVSLPPQDVRLCASGGKQHKLDWLLLMRQDLESLTEK